MGGYFNINIYEACLIIDGRGWNISDDIKHVELFWVEEGGGIQISNMSNHGKGGGNINIKHVYSCSSVHIQFSRTASCDHQVDAKFMLGQTQTKLQHEITSATRPQTLESSSWFKKKKMSKCMLKENKECSWQFYGNTDKSGYKIIWV